MVGGLGEYMVALIVTHISICVSRIQGFSTLSKAIKNSIYSIGPCAQAIVVIGELPNGERNCYNT